MKLSIVLILILAGCGVHQPNLDTGEGCWRFSVLEEGNTGRMTRLEIEDIPVVRLNYPDLAKACGVELEEPSFRNRKYMQVLVCFKPREVNGKAGTDTIYMWHGAGSVQLYEEKCHALLGRKHNACYGKGYAQWGKDIQAACLWNDT